MIDVGKLATGELLYRLERHPRRDAPPPEAHRVVVGYVALVAHVCGCTAGVAGEAFGEGDALAAADELQRRAQEAAKALPPAVRNPLVSGLDGARAAARAAVVHTRRSAP